MSGWYLTRRDPGDSGAAAKTRLEAAQHQFELHGFTRFERLCTDHHDLLHAHPIHGGIETFASTADNWISVAGTLLYDGRGGREALLALLKDFRSPFLVDERLTGHFVIVLHKMGVTHVCTDWFGTFQLFHDPICRTLTTSFLTLCNESERLRLRTQGVYEYVFHGFPTGDDTVFEEISRLGPEHQLTLDADTTWVPAPKFTTSSVETGSLDRLAGESAELLLEIASSAHSTWADNIQCPLSGGLDSRLVLGLLRHCGAMPHVYVYGSAASSDVRVARSIAEALEFPLDQLDKSLWIDPSKSDPVQRALTQFHEIDGLAIDGSLFDDGAHSFARRRRQAGGALAVSGGCGEVFRDFFFLADRPFDAVDLVRSFFSRYDPRCLSSRFVRELYESNLVDKLLVAIGAQERTLSRQQVEAAYPRMRCRAFFGREISLVGRFGGYLLPFLQPGVVRHAMSIPVRHKRAGAFESRIMTLVEPKLAEFQSSYGHGFDRPPSGGHRSSEWLTRIRPVSLRSRSYELRQRMTLGAPVSSESPAVRHGLIPPDFPWMSEFFHVAGIKDPVALDRVATLEYLATHLRDRLRA